MWGIWGGTPKQRGEELGDHLEFWDQGQVPAKGSSRTRCCDGAVSGRGAVGLHPILITRGTPAILAVLWVQKLHVPTAGRGSWQPQGGFGRAGIWKLPEILKK